MYRYFGILPKEFKYHKQKMDYTYKYYAIILNSQPISLEKYEKLKKINAIGMKHYELAMESIGKNSEI